TTTKDFAEWTKGTGQLDLTAPDIQAMFRAAARRRVVLTPTAVVEEAAWVGDREGHHEEEQKRFYTPEAWKAVERFVKGPAPCKSSTDERTQARKKNQEFIRRAHEAGCLLSTGTDDVLLTTLPGWSLWREMEIFAEAALTPMEVLKAATWNGAYA